MACDKTLEVAFVSDGTTGVSVWNISNGTQLKTYRHTASISQNCISQLGHDYLLAAGKSSPIIYAWPINSQERTHQVRMLCGGKINALAASPDGVYIAVAVGEKLHLWLACSGKLLTIVSRHFQPITIIKWSSDGSYVITGGEDGLVCVWSLAKLTNKSYYNVLQTFSSGDQTDQSAPLYIYSDHSVRIVGIFIGNCVRCIRLFTTSVDKTCKIYDLSTGTMLLSIAFDIIPSCLTVDSIETAVYIGTTLGPIRSFDLTSPPRTRECYISDKECGTKFIGHDKAVTNLSVTLSCDTLVSSSTDHTVRTWHIASRQCLRTIQLKEPVINMFLTLIPRQLTANELCPSIVLKSFQNSLGTDDSLVELVCPNDLYLEENSMYTSKDDINKKLRDELETVKSLNARLYELSLKYVLKDGETNSTENLDLNKFSMVNLYDEASEADIKHDEQPSTTNSNEKASTQKKRKRRKKSKSDNAGTCNIYTYS